MGRRASVKATADFVNLITDLIRSELDKRDSTAVARIVNINANGTYDVYIEPDEQNIIHNISAISGMQELESGDYVYIYKIRNQLQNSFIIKKI